MDIKILFAGNEIKISSGAEEYTTVLGNVTCMIAEGDWKILLNFLDIRRNSSKYTAYAENFLEKCFSEKEKQSKIDGYKLCDLELGLSEKKHTVSKSIGEDITDTYHVTSVFDLINLEMLYAVMNDIPISKCKSCGKYFAAASAGAQYCERIFDGGRTCKQAGAKRLFTESLKSDDALLQYEKTYQATYYKYKRADSAKEKSALNQKILTLKNLRVRYKHGDISATEFLKLIENNY